MRRGSLNALGTPKPWATTAAPGHLSDRATTEEPPALGHARNVHWSLPMASWSSAAERSSTEQGERSSSVERVPGAKKSMARAPYSVPCSSTAPSSSSSGSAVGWVRPSKRIPGSVWTQASAWRSSSMSKVRASPSSSSQGLTRRAGGSCAAASSSTSTSPARDMRVSAETSATMALRRWASVPPGNPGIRLSRAPLRYLRG
mmetsp:Transcript_15506/g.45846  ORF Transcript_15506/g.45846 Transcript_15506/m.45846 type:complete len:202 (+) Transcript_15506:37-642(+)